MTLERGRGMVDPTSARELRGRRYLAEAKIRKLNDEYGPEPNHWQLALILKAEDDLAEVVEEMKAKGIDA